MQSVQLFIVFEKIHHHIWFSKSLKLNHAILLLPYNWLYTINLFLKLELKASNYLIEHSCIDVSFYKEFQFIGANVNNIVFYSYYNYYLNKKLTIFFVLKNFIKLSSIDSVFNNAGWLERESSEMYGIFFKNKNDTRRLLLDYIKSEHPLQKNFQLEDTSDIFYDIFENQTTFSKNHPVEL